MKTALALVLTLASPLALAALEAAIAKAKSEGR